MKLYLFTKQRSCRLSYILSEFLRYSSFEGFEIVEDTTQIPDQAICINYSEITIDVKNIQVIPSGLLTENNNLYTSPPVNFRYGIPWFFKTGDNGVIWDYDVFSMMFFMLSRMEEYCQPRRDDMGRAIGAYCFSALNSFLTLPVIDLWKKIYWKNLSEYWNIPLQSYFPKGLNWTIDVDLAWAFRFKPFWKNILSLIKEWSTGQKDAVRLRWQFITKGKDPFDTYDLLEACAAMPMVKMTLFFLLGDRTKLDQNHPHDHPALIQLIRTLQKKYTCGLHPSSKAFYSDKQFSVESQRWQEITGFPVTCSRQHYLLLHLPDTYRKLIKAGIKADYSMGYHDRVGYRAGTACPFAWYDLENEELTELIVHPFYAMDGTYKKYQDQTPEEALNDIRAQVNFLAKEGFPFTLIWHNSSMSDLMGWKGWSSLPTEICSYASKKYS